MRVRDNDSMPVPNEDAGNVLASLSRIDYVYAAGWENGRVSWLVDVPRHEELCAHLKVRRIVERAVSTHQVVK